jgi:hypothetical protein
LIIERVERRGLFVSMAQRLGISHLTIQEGEMKELSITKEIPHNTASP